MPASARPSLRKVRAFRDLPSLASPDRFSNPPSYPHFQPPPGARIPDESPLPLISPLEPSYKLSQDVENSIHRWISKVPEVHIDHRDPVMFQFPDKYASAPSTPGGSPRSWTRPVRRRSWILAPRKIALIVCGCLGIWMLNMILPLMKHHVGCSNL